MNTPAHPAKFSASVLDIVQAIVDEDNLSGRVIDPFAGVGRIGQLAGIQAVAVEIEADWAHQAPNSIVASALTLPFRSRQFDGLVTSPCYGNRLADHHVAKDGSVRHSYTHTIGHDLHPDNAGTLQWGNAYRSFHAKAWHEVLRVLKPGAFVIVNVSNHIRAHQVQTVTEWHLSWFLARGCVLKRAEPVATPRHREGANYKARVDFETVFHLTAPTI